MMGVDIDPRETVKAGRPQALFQTGIPVSSAVDQYGVTSDGQRFIVIKPVPNMASPQLTVVLNWTAGLKK
jgi:hypothetical protein